MKAKTNHDVFSTVISGLGISAEKHPSVSFPIAVDLLYYDNPDGSVRCIWPKGEWMKKVHGLLSSLGWQNAMPGRLVLYTDVPTATLLHMQWQRNKSLLFGTNAHL
jgi:hypothetical protein